MEILRAALRAAAAEPMKHRDTARDAGGPGRAHADRAVHRRARRGQGQARAAGPPRRRCSSEGAGFAGPSIWGTGLPRIGPRSEYYGRGDAEHRTRPALDAGLRAHRVRRLRGRRALRRLPAPGAAPPDRAAGRARLDAAHRHRARVLPAAPHGARHRAGRCRRPPRQALVRPEEPAAPARVSAAAGDAASPPAGSTSSRSTTKTRTASTSSTSTTPTR